MLRRIIDALRGLTPQAPPPPQARIIRCPECGYVQAALVEWLAGAPWPSFGHTCEHCGHEIMESDSEEISPFFMPEGSGDLLHAVRPYQGQFPTPRKLAGTAARCTGEEEQ